MDLFSNENNLLEVVKTLRKVHDDKQKKSQYKKLFEDDNTTLARINLVVSLCKLPKIPVDGKMQPITIKGALPNGFVDESTDILLITKNLKGYKKDFDHTIHSYKDLLRDHNAAELITEVLPIGKLKYEYMDFEAKRALASQFDIVLCDASIIRLVPKLLGKPFYSKKKIPIQVNLKAKNLKGELLKVLSKAYLHLSLAGNSSMVQIARMNQTDEEIAENIKSLIETLKQKLLGGWSNIRSLHIKTDISKALPLYINTESPLEVPPVKHPQDKEMIPLEDNLSTLSDNVISIYSSGDVQIIPRKIPSEKRKQYLENIENKKLTNYDRYNPQKNTIIKGTKAKVPNMWHFAPKVVKVPKQKKMVKRVHKKKKVT